MPDIDTLLLVTLLVAYSLAGTVKGVLGTGLPTVAVPIVAMVVPVPVAIALTAIPVIASNIWQTLHGGHHIAAVRRFWPLLLTLVIFCSISAWLLVSVDPRATSTVLGVLLLSYCALQLMPLHLETPPRAERWLSPAVGAFAGMLGGMIMIGPPLIVYLFSLRLSKDEFVSTIAIFHLVGSLPLYIVLIVKSVLSTEEMLLSIFVTLPLLAGLVLGTHLRQHISQRTFQRMLIVLLFLVAINLIRRGIGG